MLADEGEGRIQAGALDSAVHLPTEWLSSLVRFIAEVLPGWRDDPSRPAQTGEDALTSQLCAKLSSVSRHRAGWDMLQFRREEPDEADPRRSIDLAVAPRGSIIWISGRAYSEYQTLLPIECKRLPTPIGPKRDEREYLYNRFSTTGGVHRFKAGHHGAFHPRGAMIAYIQNGRIAQWTAQLDNWVDELSASVTEGWSAADKLTMAGHDPVARVAMLKSVHGRLPDLGPVDLDHLWIEM